MMVKFIEIPRRNGKPFNKPETKRCPNEGQLCFCPGTCKEPLNADFVTIDEYKKFPQLTEIVDDQH